MTPEQWILVRVFLLGAARGQDRSLDALLGGLGAVDARVLEVWAREELERTPGPLASRSAARRRRALERLIAELCARRGDPRPLEAMHLEQARSGGKPAPLLEHLRRLGRTERAEAYARVFRRLAHKKRA